LAGGSFGSLAGLNAAINKYNDSVANQATPAGQVLIGNGLFTLEQLQQIGAVAPTLRNAPSDQLLFPWVKALDFRVSWSHSVTEHFKIEPSVGIFNIFNFANFNLTPGVMKGGWTPTAQLTAPPRTVCPGRLATLSA
jgi:hypothetical protein